MVEAVFRHGPLAGQVLRVSDPPPLTVCCYASPVPPPGELLPATEFYYLVRGRDWKSRRVYVHAQEWRAWREVNLLRRET